LKSAASIHSAGGVDRGCEAAQGDGAVEARGRESGLKSGEQRPRGYVGRFAPSPTGPLHAGSLQTALASWLDARAHEGRWLLRIEDVDTPRCTRSAALDIIACLAAHGLHPDGAIGWQSLRRRRYDAAIAKLLALGRLYRCDCSRSRIAAALRRGGWIDAPHRERPYPGLCRSGMRNGGEGALRLRLDPGEIVWEDRQMGSQVETPALSIGDFVLRRADGIDSYHLAVVVDDEADGVTDVVRGDDLLGSTARQIALQRVLGYRSLRYLHLPVLRDVRGEKLSKQQGARALDVRDAVPNLQSAVEALGLGRIGEGGIEGSGERGIRRTRDGGIGSIRGVRVESILAEAIVRWRQTRIAVEPVIGTAARMGSWGRGGVRGGP